MADNIILGIGCVLYSTVLASMSYTMFNRNDIPKPQITILAVTNMIFAFLFCGISIFIIAGILGFHNLLRP